LSLPSRLSDASASHRPDQLFSAQGRGLQFIASPCQGETPLPADLAAAHLGR
jgi:hypothetical protein